MENNYQYLDPEEKYTNSKGVLHNLANIKILSISYIHLEKEVEGLNENF